MLLISSECLGKVRFAVGVLRANREARHVPDSVGALETVFLILEKRETSCELAAELALAVRRIVACFGRLVSM